MLMKSFNVITGKRISKELKTALVQPICKKVNQSHYRPGVDHIVPGR